MSAVSSHRWQRLHEGWELCSAAPGAAEDPAALDALGPTWRPAIVPGTVAVVLRQAGELDLERAPDFDAFDWWYRCRFTAARADARVLVLEGLATIADVWLNGRLVLRSSNMFVDHTIDVDALLDGENDLLIRFRSLRAELARRRPRPGWKTKLVEDQQLRWFRTTLLGRMPGWSPPVRTVGPWREVRLELRDRVVVEGGDLWPRTDGDGGVVNVDVVVRALDGFPIDGARVEIGNAAAPLSLQHMSDDRLRLVGELRLSSIERWWPHTHGEQPRYPARVVLASGAGDVVIDAGPLAFRSIDVDRGGDGFALRVNGAEIFCRGACWTTTDIASPDGTRESIRATLTLARDAGMNMIRVGGTMVYESDDFYDLCDELGILVWQDFMFANMDYPADDPEFATNVERETESVLTRLRRHPSLAVLCGNSEVEQQAAMLGLPAERWTNALFRDRLPALVDALAPGVAYVRASPTGGALPFHVDAGVAHYYGVGAYLRPLEDARRANVRFTTECLGFANVPEPAVVDAVLPGGEAPFHHPRWKARVPRDHGAGWDFEDVRDHYLKELFGVDPMRERYADAERYLALSRVVTGEVMARVIGEWRRPGSTCRGALVWFLRDLWPGAGWGVLDADGHPKAAYYALRRAMAPVSVSITDEGSNGLDIHVISDAPRAFEGEVHIALHRRSATTPTAHAAARITIPPRGARTLKADALLGRFLDPGYAFRFGPPGHDLVVARLIDDRGQVVSEAFHFPVGMPSERTGDTGLTGEARRIEPGLLAITLRTERFAQAVWIDGGDFVPDDNHFHLAPGSERTVLARAAAGITRPRFGGYAQPLNATEGVSLPIREAISESAPLDAPQRYLAATPAKERA